MKNTRLKFIILSTLLILSILGAYFTFQQSFTESNLTFLNQAPQKPSIIYVSGAVKSPGIYELEADSRIYDAIDAAGGFDENADAEYINNSVNLASKILDEQKITIPFENTSTSEMSAQTQSGLININNASEAELDSLPGIGPATAKKIIQARPFQNIEDLKSVAGIGDSKFTQIKDLVTV